MTQPTLHLTELRFAHHSAPRDTQTLHRTILHALDVDNPGRVLWANPTRDIVIVQAGAPIRAAAIGGVVESHSGPARPRWASGTPVRISLIGNPVTLTPTPRGVRGRRIPLPIDQHADWLRRKLDGAVTLHDVAVQPLGTRTGARHEATVTHRLSAFYATGTVTNPDTLERLIRDGVGPAKAYGAGLLLVGAAS